MQYLSEVERGYDTDYASHAEPNPKILREDLMISKKEFDDRLTEEEAQEANAIIRNLATQLMRRVRGRASRGETTRKLMEALIEAGELAKNMSQMQIMAVERVFDNLDGWKLDDPKSDSQAEELRAIDTMCSGALQVVASRLSGVTQGDAEGKGASELARGAQDYGAAIQRHKARP